MWWCGVGVGVVAGVRGVWGGCGGGGVGGWWWGVLGVEGLAWVLDGGFGGGLWGCLCVVAWGGVVVVEARSEGGVKCCRFGVGVWAGLVGVWCFWLLWGWSGCGCGGWCRVGRGGQRRAGGCVPGGGVVVAWGGGVCCLVCRVRGGGGGCGVVVCRGGVVVGAGNREAPRHPGSEPGRMGLSGRSTGRVRRGLGLRAWRGSGCRSSCGEIGGRARRHRGVQSLGCRSRGWCLPERAFQHAVAGGQGVGSR